MEFEETALVFACEGEALIGILTQPAVTQSRGVLFIVGGPQYRAGSHRQFTLLSRGLAQSGIPSLRFDYRGMGDSTGDQRDFERINHDIRAAADTFFKHMPQLRELVLWGLCDAASAAMMYAPQDKRVAGLVLLNPWVRTSAGLSKAQLKHYYWKRLSKGEFWRKFFSGRFDLLTSLKGISGTLVQILKKNTQSETGNAAVPLSLPERMLGALEKFDGPVLLILSGQDLTAREFEDAVQSSLAWQRRLRLQTVTQYRLPDANHTFSQRVWRDQVRGWTADWMHSW
ncbi:MAG: hydrolase 1, exosortase A system-associated [Burkholderiales bacterium]